MSARTRGGFTLIETIAVIAITGFLIASIVGMYIGIMGNSERATEGTRNLRVATAVLDRVARDLERAYVLVKEEDEDPLAHPWLFVAETNAGQVGSDRVMFTTLSHASQRSRDGQASASGLATYAYWLDGDPDLGYELVRWVQPSLDHGHRFPDAQDESAVVLADGLAGFSLHFLNEFGEWTEQWDSTALVESGELPMAIEMRLSVPPSMDPAESSLREEFGERIEPTEYRRRVVLYQRPVSREVALGLGGVGAGAGADDEEGDEDRIFEEEGENGCKIMSFAECFNRLGGFDAAVGHLTEAEQAVWRSRLTKCVARDNESLYPFAIGSCR